MGYNAKKIDAECLKIINDTLHVNAAVLRQIEISLKNHNDQIKIANERIADLEEVVRRIDEDCLMTEEKQISEEY